MFSSGWPRLLLTHCLNGLYCWNQYSIVMSLKAILKLGLGLLWPISCESYQICQQVHQVPASSFPVLEKKKKKEEKKHQIPPNLRFVIYVKLETISSFVVTTCDLKLACQEQFSNYLKLWFLVGQES